MHNQRTAFTLVELLVVIAIIGILVSLLLPAVQNARESARRVSCENKLAQLANAMQQYLAANETLPSGTVANSGPIENLPQGLDQSWTIFLLPYLDELVAFEKIDLTASVYDKGQASVRDHPIPVLICPSDWSTNPLPSSNYAGCHHHLESPIDTDNLGVLFLNSHIGRADITDGQRYTFLLGEKKGEPTDLGWLSGTRATLRNTGGLLNLTVDPTVISGDPLYVGGFSSAHPNGAQFAYCDGSVSLITDQVDLDVYQHMANRADGELIDLDILR